MTMHKRVPTRSGAARLQVAHLAEVAGHRPIVVVIFVVIVAAAGQAQRA